MQQLKTTVSRETRDIPHKLPLFHVKRRLFQESAIVSRETAKSVGISALIAPNRRKRALFHVEHVVYANIYNKIIKNAPKSLTYRDNNGIIVYRSELSAASPQNQSKGEKRWLKSYLFPTRRAE